MGWSFEKGQTKEGLISELTDHDSCLQHRLCWEHEEDVLWMLVRLENGSVIVALAFLREEASYGWGYKLIDESMGPFYYSCPVAFLDAASVPPNGIAKRWRSQVRDQGVSA